MLLKSLLKHTLLSKNSIKSRTSGHLTISHFPLNSNFMCQKNGALMVSMRTSSRIFVPIRSSSVLTATHWHGEVNFLISWDWQIMLIRRFYSPIPIHCPNPCEIEKTSSPFLAMLWIDWKNGILNLFGHGCKVSKLHLFQSHPDHINKQQLMMSLRD